MTTSTLSGRDIDPAVLCAQIGWGNVAATSGGRRTKITSDTVVFPVRYGWQVHVTLASNDTYTVKRVFARGGKSTVKGERTDVHCEDVGEAVYRAGCYHDPFSS